MELVHLKHESSLIVVSRSSGLFALRLAQKFGQFNAPMSAELIRLSLPNDRARARALRYSQPRGRAIASASVSATRLELLASLPLERNGKLVCESALKAMGTTLCIFITPKPLRMQELLCPGRLTLLETRLFVDQLSADPGLSGLNWLVRPTPCSPGACRRPSAETNRAHKPKPQTAAKGRLFISLI